MRAAPKLATYRKHDEVCEVSILSMHYHKLEMQEATEERITAKHVFFLHFYCNNNVHLQEDFELC